MYSTQAPHSRDYLQPLENQYVEACKEECRFKNIVPCDQDVYDICELLMLQNGWQKAEDADTGLDLYKRLRECLLTLM